MFDIISIGDATIDTFLFINDVEIKNIDGKQKAILNWGDKLPVEELHKTVAGNATNNAVGSSRLGLRVGFYTVLAHDTGGREIIHKMKKEGVSERFIVIDEKHSTNASFVISNKGERTILVYHQHRHYDLPKLPHSKWVYLTSMGEGFETIYKDLCKYLDKYEVNLGFNPGTFMLRAGPKINSEILKRTTLLSVNVEEAQGWVGENGRDPEILCKKLADLGPKAIALTDGRKGAYSYSSEGFFYAPEYPGERIEATGAGDSFTTAYIAGLFYGLSHQNSLLWGPINAGSVVQKVGPQAGLLTKQEIEMRLKKLKSFKVVAITDEKTKKKVLEIVSKKND